MIFNKIDPTSGKNETERLPMQVQLDGASHGDVLDGGGEQLRRAVVRRRGRKLGPELQLQHDLCVVSPTAWLLFRR